MSGRFYDYPKIFYIFVVLKGYNNVKDCKTDI